MISQKTIYGLLTVFGLSCLEIGGYTLSSYPQAEATTSSSVQRPSQKASTKIVGSFDRDSQKAEWLGGTATLIVEAHVSKIHPAKSGTSLSKLMSGSGSSRPLKVAWKDVEFDQVKPIWRDAGVPQPTTPLIVRVYNADTPEVEFSIEGEAQFVEGEKYVLLLTEMDGIGPGVGTEHWRALTGSTGAYLLSSDGKSASRKGEFFKNDPPISKSQLLQDLSTGYNNVDMIQHWRQIRKSSPKGIQW